MGEQQGLSVALLVQSCPDEHRDIGWGGGSRGTLCPGEMRPQDSGVLLVQHVRRGGAGGVRAPSGVTQERDGLGSSAGGGQAGPGLVRSVFGQTELEKTKSHESSVRKGTQSKGNGLVPKAKVTRGQRSLLSKRSRQPGQGRGPSCPRGQAQALLTSSHCWRWYWPHRRCRGRRAAGRSCLQCPPRPPASRGGQRSGPARAAPRAAGTDTTE